MSEQTPAPRRGFSFAALIAAALIGLIGGGLTTVAVGHGGAMRGGHHWGGGHHGPLDPAEAKEHAEEMVEHFGWVIDATDEQEKQLKTIATGMVTDLIPAHEKMRAARGRIAELLRAPKTDRAALETLRAEHVALADETSKRLTQGLADASDVLTPDQRAKLAERWKN
jgi:periplasmic protein CpxP/Spy